MFLAVVASALILIAVVSREQRELDGRQPVRVSIPRAALDSLLVEHGYALEDVAFVKAHVSPFIEGTAVQEYSSLNDISLDRRRVVLISSAALKGYHPYTIMHYNRVAGVVVDQQEFDLIATEAAIYCK